MKLEIVSDEFEQCIKCGLCLATCPVCKELLFEKFTPRGKVQLARYYSLGRLDLSEQYREIFARCLLCGACSVTCPSGVDLKKVFLSMREEITKEKGLHPNMEEVVKSLLSKYNMSDEDNEERADWRDFMKDLPQHMYEKDKAEVAYFVGCVASFFPMVQKIPQNLARILDMAHVDFAILGGEEWCCGYPLIGAGATEMAQQMMEHNIEKVEKLGARGLIFTCPTCYCTWNEYHNKGLDLYHSTQFIEKLIDESAVHLGRIDATITYHDPCDLGRNGGIYDAPRHILNSIPGLKLVEMETSRAKSTCCGGGGNLEMADPSLSGSVAQKRLEEIQRTGADIVVTSCQQCVRTITSRARRQKLDLRVCDITELVLSRFLRHH